MNLQVIKTLMRVAWCSLKRDRVALCLIFVLPIIFFSIFAIILQGASGGSSGGGGSTRGMKVIAVDEDQTEISRRFLDTFGKQDGVNLSWRPSVSEDDPNPALYDREIARLQVRKGRYSAAVIIPKGFGEAFGSFTGGGAPVDLIYDSVNPIAQFSMQGLLQTTSFTAAPDILISEALAQLEKFGGPLTPAQLAVIDFIEQLLTSEQDSLEDDENGTTTQVVNQFQGLIKINTSAARTIEDEGEKKPPNMVAYFAAGIGVMFLLFSMSGAGESLLKEEEQGTLERVLTSHANMTLLLVSVWLFFALIGIAQLTVMFLWGAFVFGLDLFTFNHFTGFLAMTILTSLAAAAFGIVLATLVKTRAQYAGMATIIILIMSALGGSMVPKFVAPAIFETTSKFTFNGWAIDGYLNVFWNEDPNQGIGGMFVSILPQLGVLAGMTIVFLLVARLLARRWEAV